MTLYEPFLIGPRLLPALKIGGVWVSMEHIGCADNRMVFRTYFDGPDWRAEDSSLKSGTQGCSLQEAFESLLTFLGACADSRKYERSTGRVSENSSLFAPRVAEWAEENADEIETLCFDLEDSPKTLIEE